MKSTHNSAWHPLFTLPGELRTLDAINAAVSAETSDPAPWFEDEDSLARAVKDGWITWENGQTIIWEDAAI